MGVSTPLSKDEAADEVKEESDEGGGLEPAAEGGKLPNCQSDRISSLRYLFMGAKKWQGGNI